jgi:excisionase family DNA binding protein
MAAPMLMTAKSAARYLGISRATLKRLTDNGDVPVWRDPSTSRQRYSRLALDLWLTNNCKPVAS